VSVPTRIRGRGAGFGAGLTVCLGLLAFGCQREERTDLLVFAAASLTDVTEALADSFSARFPDVQVRVSVAATSILARQIRAGAEPAVFLAASHDWMAWLDSTGRLSEWRDVPFSTELVIVGRFNGVSIRDPHDLLHVDRVAVADPEHVPGGIYARHGLECLGLWENLSSRLVPTLDVRAALDALESGATDAAIVYAADVYRYADQFVAARWPADCQPEIKYAIGIPKRPPIRDVARTFVDFAIGAAQEPVWANFGFSRRRP